MRPRYETPEDLAREKTVMALVGKVWGCEFTKLPDRYRLDYALTVENKAIGFAEIKCRNNSSLKYDTWFISAEKVQTAQTWKALGVPASALIMFTDGLFIVDLGDPDYFSPGGRYDRGDKDDHELMAHFGQAKLRRFSGDTRVTRTLVPHL